MCDAGVAARLLGESRGFGGLHTFVKSDAAGVAGAILGALYPHEVDAACSSISLEAFQRVAVSSCRAAISRWGGVMLCDDVGLGKTYVALELARDALSRGQPVLIVMPSSLRTQWIPLLRKHAPAARVLTHAQLSRGAYPAALAEGGGLLVIDEAHAFRSPRTRRYRAAAVLARTRQVCLITATPVNNTMWDMYHLIRLFANDASFAAIGVSDLHSLFADAMHAVSPPHRFRRLLRLIMVRRSRADIRSDETIRPARLRFPDLATPRPIAYQPDCGDASHRSILHSIVSLRLSAIDGASSGLLRFLLLKRLASSPPAFRSTVARLLRFHRDFVSAADDGLLLCIRDSGQPRGDRSFEQLTMNRLVLRPLRPGEPIAILRDAAVHDVSLLTGMLLALDRSSGSDDKFLQLHRLLLGELHDRKVLVFTEFRETATYLWRRLVSTGGVGLVHGGDSFLGSARAGRHAVIERFARAHNARRAFPPRERVRLLIATDVLSEGLNLQDCAHVVSYDLPWNPVRLIQRIGRIDRLGSPHDRVYAYNFLPDQHLEDYLRILGRLRIKLHAIGMSLGLEPSVLADRLSDDDAMNGWNHIRDLDADHVQSPRENDELTDMDMIAWMRMRTVQASPGRSHFTESCAVPVASVFLAGAGAGSVCVIMKRETGVWAALCAPDADPEEIDPQVVAAACVRSCDRAPQADIEFDLIERSLLRVRQFVGSNSFSAQNPELCAHRASAAAVRVARRLRNAVAAAPGGPTSVDLGAIDRSLGRLSEPLSTAALVDLDRLARRSPSLQEILTTLNDVFSQERVNSGRPSSRLIRAESVEIVAVIVTLSVLYTKDNVPSING